MIDSTQQKGLLTELDCIRDFTRLGFQCLQPVGDSCKYDIAVDTGTKIYRIQCKHSHWAKDTQVPETAFEISLRRQTTNTQKTIHYKYSSEEIDYFYTSFNGQGYLVSINEAVGALFRWRYEYPNPHQRQGIHLAANYTIEEVTKQW